MRARAFVLAVGLCVANAANAQPAKGIGVVVTGDATLQPQMQAQVEDWLQQRGHALAAAPLRPDALTAMLDCFVIEDLECAYKVFDGQANAAELVYAKVDMVESGGTTRDIAITGYWFTRSGEPMAVRRVCKACTDPRTTLDDVITSLAGKDRAARGSFELVTTPPGARVAIDGKDAGTTPLSMPLAPGTHEVVIRRGGYATQTTHVTISEGKPNKLELALEEESDRGPLPYLVGAAGVAMLGTGIALYLTSEEDTGEKLMYRDTKPAGIVLSAAGAVTLGVATWLFLRSGRSSDDRPAGAPAVSIVPGAATLGWMGAF